MQSESTKFKEWISRRVSAVDEVYSAFECLMEAGIDLIDKGTDFQISCPLPSHGPDNRPSARYYGSGSYPHFYCFKCKLNANGVNLYATLKGLRFMQALQDLERRFNIKIPKKPDTPEITEPTDRRSNYMSDRWSDIPSMLKIAETSLLRLRNKCTLPDYIKFCRVLDAVEWDFDKTKVATPSMVEVLQKLRLRMLEALDAPEPPSF